IFQVFQPGNVAGALFLLRTPVSLAPLQSAKDVKHGAFPLEGPLAPVLTHLFGGIKEKRKPIRSSSSVTCARHASPGAPSMTGAATFSECAGGSTPWESRGALSRRT